MLWLIIESSKKCLVFVIVPIYEDKVVISSFRRATKNISCSIVDRALFFQLRDFLSCDFVLK